MVSARLSFSRVGDERAAAPDQPIPADSISYVASLQILTHLCVIFCAFAMVSPPLEAHSGACRLWNAGQLSEVGAPISYLPRA